MNKKKLLTKNRKNILLNIFMILFSLLIMYNLYNFLIFLKTGVINNFLITTYESVVFLIIILILYYMVKGK